MADLTMEAAFNGKTLDDATRDEEQFRHLGFWSDGRKVNPPIVGVRPGRHPPRDSRQRIADLSLERPPVQSRARPMPSGLGLASAAGRTAGVDHGSRRSVSVPRAMPSDPVNHSARVALDVRLIPVEEPVDTLK